MFPKVVPKVGKGVVTQFHPIWHPKPHFLPTRTRFRPWAKAHVSTIVRGAARTQNKPRNTILDNVLETVRQVKLEVKSRGVIPNPESMEAYGM